MTEQERAPASEMRRRVMTAVITAIRNSETFGSTVDAALSAIRPGDRLPAGVVAPEEPARKFGMGARVTKLKGSSWTGRVVGFYSTSLTPVGYAIESENEPGSVQVYPEAAIAAAKETTR